MLDYNPWRHYYGTTTFVYDLYFFKCDSVGHRLDLAPHGVAHSEKTGQIALEKKGGEVHIILPEQINNHNYKLL